MRATRPARKPAPSRHFERLYPQTQIKELVLTIVGILIVIILILLAIYLFRRVV